jgi:glycosyltransferase involved in cell wall biosynthesis
MHPVTDDPDTTAHRLLLISYWYPPALGAAAERIHGFAKYLPHHGWQTHVLTAEHPNAQSDPQDAAAPDTRGPAATPTVHAVTDPLAPETPAFPDYDPTAKPPTLKRYLRQMIFPDRFFRWERAAFKRGQEVIGGHKFDLLLASFPPASAVVLALRLHRDTGVPLVLDFRDRWLGPGGYQPQRDRSRRKHAQLEHDAVNCATAVIAVSDAMATAIAEEQHYDRERIFVIPNGYEPAKPASAPSTLPAAGPTTISHVGTVIPRNRPELFFESISGLRSDGRLLDVVFKFVGNLSRDYISAARLSSIIETTGMLPRAEARREMQNAHALLLLTGAYVGRWGNNAKLFEYLQTGRPILCLEETPGSNDRKLLEEFAPDRAFFAPMDNPEAIADEISKLRAHVRAHPTPAIELDDAFRAYSRPNLTAQLEERLNAILPQPPSQRSTGPVAQSRRPPA